MVSKNVRSFDGAGLRKIALYLVVGFALFGAGYLVGHQAGLESVKPITDKFWRNATDQDINDLLSGRLR